MASSVWDVGLDRSACWQFSGERTGDGIRYTMVSYADKAIRNRDACKLAAQGWRVDYSIAARYHGKDERGNNIYSPRFRLCASKPLEQADG